MLFFESDLQIFMKDCGNVEVATPNIFIGERGPLIQNHFFFSDSGWLGWVRAPPKMLPYSNVVADFYISLNLKKTIVNSFLLLLSNKNGNFSYFISLLRFLFNIAITICALFNLCVSSQTFVPSLIYV